MYLSPGFQVPASSPALWSAAVNVFAVAAIAVLLGAFPAAHAGDPAEAGVATEPVEPDAVERHDPEALDEFHQAGEFPEEKTDADQDGVADIDDNCPGTQPETFTEIGSLRTQVDECGCPKDPCQCDADNDGVADCRDLCPESGFGVLVDAQGCTLPVVEPWREDVRVEFDFESHELRPQFEPLLVKVQERLKSAPNLVVTLEGHTDWKGPQSYNEPLSGRRAEACREFLLKDPAIAPSRVRTRAFGELRPVADNASEEGRARNRRVEALFEDIRQPAPLEAISPVEESN
jgi:outer membrane protein OmpA-like peptidoglycan-associated protein